MIDTVGLVHAMLHAPAGADRAGYVARLLGWALRGKHGSQLTPPPLETDDRKIEAPVRSCASFRGYQAAWLRSDISAGLAIAAVGIPSAIAYPAIAGLPPETGIYASIASVIGYALFGPSRRLIVGPDAPTMAVLAGVIGTVAGGLSRTRRRRSRVGGSV